MESKSLVIAIRWIVVIALPFMLTLVTLRALIVWDSPDYPTFEYGRIAPDPFGFTQAERLEMAQATLNYLRRPESADHTIHLLEELKLPGTDEPLYNPREIGHMIDVKRLADLFRGLMWALLLIVAAGLVLLLLRPATRPEGYRALWHGGLLTAAILALFVILIGVAWSLLFTQFHQLLFPPDTWQFAYSDSLIRLFPEQFWIDFGTIWTVAVLLEGIVMGAAGYFLLRR